MKTPRTVGFFGFARGIEDREPYKNLGLLQSPSPEINRLENPFLIQLEDAVPWTSVGIDCGNRVCREDDGSGKNETLKEWLVVVSENSSKVITDMQELIKIE